jgi:rhodanese-related sulfurtransferase
MEVQMRYIIETSDEQGLIGIQIEKWRKENKLELIEKGQPIIEIQAHLERVSKALEVLRKAGYNSYVMKMFLYQDTKLSKRDVDAVLESQEEFFKQIGVAKK